MAVLEKSYIGSGGSGRNTAILRSNYLTPEGVRFYDASLDLYEGLAADLDFNVMFSRRGHLTLAHDDGSVRTMRRRAEVNRLQGVDSRLVFPDELARICPQLDLSDRPRFPIHGALYHPPGGIIRHDAVVWGYARGADERGVDIHQYTEVTGIDVAGGAVTGVQTNRGPVAAGTVLSAVAGWASNLAGMAGLRLLWTRSPSRPASPSPSSPSSTWSSSPAPCTSTSASPAAASWSWAPASIPSPPTRWTAPSTSWRASPGTCWSCSPSCRRSASCASGRACARCPPDYSPLMGVTPVKGFLIDAGWGTYGFKASPICGQTLAELIATGRPPDLIHPFRLSRFAEFDRWREGRRLGGPLTCCSSAAPLRRAQRLRVPLRGGVPAAALPLDGGRRRGVARLPPSARQPHGPPPRVVDPPRRLRLWFLAERDRRTNAVSRTFRWSPDGTPAEGAG